VEKHGLAIRVGSDDLTDVTATHQFKDGCVPSPGSEADSGPVSARRQESFASGVGVPRLPGAALGS